MNKATLNWTSVTSEAPDKPMINGSYVTLTGLHFLDT